MDVPFWADAAIVLGLFATNVVTFFVAHRRIRDLEDALFAKRILLDDEPTATPPTTWTNSKYSFMPGQIVTIGAGQAINAYTTLAGGAGRAVVNHSTICKVTLV